jgi:hypothetical protein
MHACLYMVPPGGLCLFPLRSNSWTNQSTCHHEKWYKRNATRSFHYAPQGDNKTRNGQDMLWLLNNLNATDLVLLILSSMNDTRAATKCLKWALILRCAPPPCAPLATYFPNYSLLHDSAFRSQKWTLLKNH